MSKVELNAEQFQRIARAVSDPNRWEMLQAVYSKPEMTCGDVTACLPITAGTASHHLKELENAELVQVVKEGRYKRLTARRDIWKAYLRMLERL